MFELQILFGNIIAPAAVVLASWLACAVLPKAHRNRLTPLVVATSSSAAIWVALAVRNGFSWWPEDAWQKVPVITLVLSVVVMLTELYRTSPAIPPDKAEEVPPTQNLPRLNFVAAIVQWAVITIFAIAAAWLIFPRGETWAELQSEQNAWCLVIALAVSLAWWGISGCRPAIAIAIGFATIPLLIASAFLTALSIMKITEPLIAIATVIGLCSLIDLRLSSGRTLPIMLPPALFAMSSFIAHASFQSYLGLPRTLYFLAMLSPAIVALVARMSQRKSTPVAILATLCTAVILAAAMASWTYVAGDVGAEPEW